MPFAAPIQDDEKKQQEQGQSQNVSGVSGGFAGVNVPGQEPSSQKKSGSGRYTNIQQYLDANKQQAGQMGSQIAQTVEGQAKQAQEQIGGLEAQAPKVEAYDPNKALQKADQLSAQEKEQYKTLKKTGGYTGPATVDQVSGYQDVQKASQKAAQNVANAATESGQQELLKQQYARPSYTAGQNRLDQALLQGAQESRSQLENLSNKYAGIDKLFEQKSGQVGSAIAEAQKQALANRQAFNPAEQAARTALINPIEERAKQTQAQNLDKIAKAKEDLKDEVISQDMLDMLGLGEGTRIYDLNLGNYLNTDETQLGLNNVATQEERQKYQALADLFEDPTMKQIDMTGKAITPVSFDKERFTKDLAAKNAWFEDLARNTNIATSGENAQNYYTGLLGTNKQTASARTDMAANLLDYLNTGNINVDGNQYSANTGGIDWRTGNASTGNAIGDAIVGGINTIGRGIFNTDATGVADSRMADAKKWANRQAQQRFYDELNRILEESNYNRAIKKG